MGNIEKLLAKNIKVLIADDVQEVRFVLKSMLFELGFTNIVEVGDGQQALKAIKTNKFQLILCDWEMPECNGGDILNFVRKSTHNKGSIFIMCTGNSKPEFVKNAISLGVSNFIIKPFNMSLIAEKVSKYFLLR